jgi:hypothetical protein
MHYTINYANLETVAEQDHSAIQDIRNWLGEERFERVDQLYRELAEPVTLDLFRLQMNFAGIQGLPVEAWYRRLWPTTE